MSDRKSSFNPEPYEEEYRGFEIRDDESSRGPLILALAIGVLIVFGAVVWNTYRQGVRPDDGALPMVVAEQQPYKRAPDDKGGIQIEDLDRRLYDAMDGSTRPPVAQTVAASNQDNLRGGPPRDLRPNNSPVNRSVVPGDVQGEDLPPVSQPSSAPETPDPVEPQLETASQAEPELRGEPDSSFTFVSGGDYLVQITAVRSEAAADRAWDTATARHPNIFSGAKKMIERADLGAKGVFYRLRAGTFGSRDSAAAFCEAFKQSGGDCIIVRETA